VATVVDLVKTLGPGLFVFLIIALALIFFAFLFAFFYFLLKHSTVTIKYKKGRLTFIKVEPPEQIDEIKLPEPPQTKAARGRKS